MLFKKIFKNTNENTIEKPNVCEDKKNSEATSVVTDQENETLEIIRKYCLEHGEPTKPIIDAIKPFIIEKGRYVFVNNTPFKLECSCAVLTDCSSFDSEELINLLQHSGTQGVVTSPRKTYIIPACVFEVDENISTLKFEEPEQPDTDHVDSSTIEAQPKENE